MDARANADRLAARRKRRDARRAAKAEELRRAEAWRHETPPEPAPVEDPDRDHKKVYHPPYDQPGEPKRGPRRQPEDSWSRLAVPHLRHVPLPAGELRFLRDLWHVCGGPQWFRQDGWVPSRPEAGRDGGGADEAA